MQDKVPTTHQTASDVVDIREVFTAIGRFFSRMGNRFILFLVHVRRVSRDYARLLIACLILGVGLGCTSYFTFKPHYASQLTLNSRYYTIEMLENSIEELDQLADEKNEVVLAKKLRISPQQAAQIRSIEVSPVVTTQDVIEIEGMLQFLERSDDLLKDKQLVQIRERLMKGFNNYIIIATVYDISILDSLEIGLAQYLKENEFVRKRVAIEQERLLSLENKLHKEQERLDRLKNIQADAYSKLAESSRTGSNNVILGGTETANDPLNVYRQDLDFYRELVNAKSQLELNQGAEVISSFTPYGEPASISLKGQLILGSLFGIATAYLIILLIGINQVLDRYETKHLTYKTAA